MNSILYFLSFLVMCSAIFLTVPYCITCVFHLVIKYFIVSLPCVKYCVLESTLLGWFQNLSPVLLTDLTFLKHINNQTIQNPSMVP